MVAAVAMLVTVFASVACSSPDTPRANPIAQPSAVTEPTKLPEIANGKDIVPLTQEELEKELSKVSFTAGNWPKTDFSRRTVALDQISAGGPPKDGIPAIDKPKFEGISEGNQWIDDQEPVLIVSVAGESKAYPHKILMWHEIVNDSVGGEAVSVTFCPLCNTSLAYSRRVGDRVLDFGTTGLLRFSNLVMYDRQTESWWQEATGKAIVGEMAGTQLKVLQFNIAAWRDFKESYPSGKVLSRDTGYHRDYGTNPYVFYDTSEPFLYDGPEDNRLRATERVLGITIKNKSLAIPYPILEQEGVINLKFAETDLVVFFVKGTASSLDSGITFDGRDVGSASIYLPIVDGKKLEFESVNGSIRDERTGSIWNIFGKAVSGDMAGKDLTPVIHHPAQFWFSWVVFKPDTQIYRGG